MSMGFDWSAGRDMTTASDHSLTDSGADGQSHQSQYTGAKTITFMPKQTKDGLTLIFAAGVLWLVLRGRF